MCLNDDKIVVVTLVILEEENNGKEVQVSQRRPFIIFAMLHSEIF